MGKIIGIDLGTTNSCVAVVDALAPKVLTNREGSRTTPSIVAFAEDDDRLVGQIAKRQAVTNPQNTVFAVKRLIGRKFDDPEVQRAREVLPYTLSKAPNGDMRVSIRGRDYSPQEISAFILTELKNFAEETLGEEVEEAIITVPAYFDEPAYIDALASSVERAYADIETKPDVLLFSKQRVMKSCQLVCPH